MKQFLLIISILAFSSMLFAKNNNYKPGYVILESGDTLVGYIKNKPWRKNPNSVTFTAPSINNDTLTYRLSEIKGFSSDEFIFVKRYVKIDQQINKINDLNDYSRAPFREDTVLLQELVGGQVNLYSYNEPKGRMHYYIDSRSTELEELLNTMYQVEKGTDYGNTKSYVGYAEEYKTQLLKTLIGCKSITYNEIDIEFKESKLYKLILNYNQCVSPNKEIYTHKVEKWKIRPYILVGVTISKLKFKSSTSWDHLTNAEFKNSITFTGNFGLKYIIPKYHEKFQIYTDFGFNMYNFESNEIEDNFFTIENSYRYTLKYKQVSFNYGLIYKFSVKEFSPYLKAGFSSLFSFSYDANKVNTKTDVAVPYISPRAYQWGVNFGAGFDVSNFCIEYQLQFATGPSSIRNLKITPITNYITLSYAFSSKKDK